MPKKSAMFAPAISKKHKRKVYATELPYTVHLVNLVSPLSICSARTINMSIQAMKPIETKVKTPLCQNMMHFWSF